MGFTLKEVNLVVCGLFLILCMNGRKKLRDLNLSKQSHFEVICRIKMYYEYLSKKVMDYVFSYKETMDPTAIPKKSGVRLQ